MVADKYILASKISDFIEKQTEIFDSIEIRLLKNKSLVKSRFISKNGDFKN
jgi:hypothetical protein